MDKFFSEVQRNPRAQPVGSNSESSEKEEKGAPKKPLPKGVVLGKDGKPCRSCTSSAAWTAMMKQQTSRTSPPSSNSSSSSSSSTTSSGSTISTLSTPSTASSDNPQPLLPANCPPDVERLGSSTWTFLHTLSAAYPSTASTAQQSEMKQFLTLFSRLYPCWHCAEDFQAWMRRRENALEGQRLAGRGGLMRWMCEAHNEVNVKLGKKPFDCGAVSLEERWGAGPGDGRCG